VSKILSKEFKIMRLPLTLFRFCDSNNNNRKDINSLQNGWLWREQRAATRIYTMVKQNVLGVQTYVWDWGGRAKIY